MEESFSILIAERNPRVRRFLRREFVADGFNVLVAENGSDLVRSIRLEESLDLLILDDELPGLDESRLVEHLSNRVPHVPFIIYSFSAECVCSSLVGTAADLVEKTGNIDGLRQAVYRVLGRGHADRLDPKERSGPETGGRNSGQPSMPVEARKT